MRNSYDYLTVVQSYVENFNNKRQSTMKKINLKKSIKNLRIEFQEN